jgi:hypothetical protein
LSLDGKIREQDPKILTMNVLDPYPDWIPIQFGVDPDPGISFPQKRKKSEEISCFELLDVVFGGL